MSITLANRANVLICMKTDPANRDPITSRPRSNLLSKCLIAGGGLELFGKFN